MTYRVTTFLDKIGATKNEFATTFAALAEWIDNLAPAPSKDHCGLFSQTVFGDKRSARGSLREAENAIEVYGVELDYDGEVMTPMHAHMTLKTAGIRHFVYTSASHRHDAPRWRVVVPFDQAMHVDARREGAEKCNGLLSGKLSSETFTLSQPFYVGRVAGVEYESYLYDEGTSPLALDLPRVPWKGARQADGSYRVTVDMLLDDLRAGTEVHPAIVALAARGFSEAELCEIVSQSCQHWERPERGRVAIESDIPRACSSWERKKARELELMLASMPIPPKPEPGEAIRVTPTGDVLHGIDFFVGQPSPQHWLIKGVVEDATHVSVFGDSGAGKSFLVVDWALSVAAGRDWEGHKVAQGGVVYLNGEGFDGWKRRVAAWMKHNAVSREALAAFAATSRCWPLTNPESLSKIWLALDQMKARVGQVKLVIIDTLNRHVLGLDINSSTEMGRFVELCDEIRQRYGCTVLIVHHSGTKDKDRAMGSVALKGALDVEINVRRKGLNVTVSASKMKDAEPFDDMHFKLTDVPLDWLANPEAGPDEVPEWQRGGILARVADPIVAGEPNVPGAAGRPNKGFDILREVLQAGSLTVTAARDKFCELAGGTRSSAAKAFNRTLKGMVDSGAVIHIEDDDVIKLPLSGE